jgi:hypothetical protein
MFAIGGKYAVEKVGEILDRRGNRKTLLGVLAAASNDKD